MVKRAFIVTGLGYGDEGKGTTVHWLAAKHRAHTVIRTGGPQAYHRVMTQNGREHIHSQFGSGTLSGTATHLSKNMVIDPHGILTEGEALKYQHGIKEVFLMLTIHEDALVITPFHAMANRLRELSRGSERYGSVGIGVGETVLDAEAYPKEAIRARDLGHHGLREKLEVVRARKIRELEEISGHIENWPEDAREKGRREIFYLNNPDTIQWAVERFGVLAFRSAIVDADYVTQRILGSRGTVVFEQSQGILLDRWHGFHPYTTKVRTIPEMALSILRESGYDGEVKSFGVLRAYFTRHGAGPFVTECPVLTKQFPDATTGNHSWQGPFRVGIFDAVQARYAIESAGGKEAIHGLVITCIDRIAELPAWNIAKSYDASPKNDDLTFFSRTKKGITGIVVTRGTGNFQRERQEKLTVLLYNCSARVSPYEIPSGGKLEDVINLCSRVLKEELNVPVVMASVGPTEKDKIEFT